MADAKIRITAEDKTRAGLLSAKKNVEGLLGALGAYKGQIGLLVGATGIIALIKKQIDLGDELSKTSQKVGVSVEALSAYQYAAKLSGTSNETLHRSLARLTAAMQDAARDGAGETALYFKNLGVSVTDTNGQLRSTEAVLEDLSRVFSAAEDGPAKSAAAIKLLGRSGVELIPLLNSLKVLKEEAKATGQIVSTEFAKKAEEFNDSMERLKLSSSRMARSIATVVIPVLANLAEHLSVVTGAAVDFSMRRLIDEQKLLANALREANEEFAQSNSAESLADIEALEKKLADINKRIEAAKKREATTSVKKGGQLATVTDTRGDDKLLADAQALRESLYTQEEDLKASLAERMGVLLAAREQEMISQATFNDTKERLEQEHQFRMIGLVSKASEETSRLWAQGLQGRLAVTSNMLGQLAGLMQSKSKSMFEIGKKAAIAEALVSTWQAVAHALSIKPFWLGLSMAGVASLKGMAAVQNIRSTTFGGGNATGTFSADSASGIPSSPPDLPAVGPVAPAGNTREVNITLQGRGFDTQSVRDLIGQINEEIGNGVNLNVTVAA